MALVSGTNCGFVTEAPTADPDGSGTSTADNVIQAFEYISPEGAGKITEIGVYLSPDTEASTIELGVYDKNPAKNLPLNLLGKNNIAKGTTAGWKSVAVDIDISPETSYWLGVSMENTATATLIDKDSGTCRRAYGGDGTTLPDPEWTDTSSASIGYIYSIYAVYEAAPAGTNMKINIDDTWKDVDSMKINIGDTWKDVAEVKQNIGDAWKTVF